MKLLYLTNGICGGGGLERVLCIKTRHFIDEQQHDVAIIRLNEQGQTPFFDFHPQIQFYDIELGAANKLSRYVLYMKAVARAVQDYQPDIIFVCDDGVKGLFVPLWLKTKAKLVYERHASLGFNNTPVAVQKLMRKAVRLYDAFVVLTPSCQQDWGNQVNIHVIANPLTQIPQQSSPLSAQRAICVGSLSHNKGYDLLIEALAKIQHVPWQVDIYGRGDQSQLRAQALQLGVSLDQLHFKGESQHIDQAYAQADFLILPSRTEGFGMVLIEAMAYGVPCVAFDCPNGPRYIIDDQQNGFLAKAQDPDDLAEKIQTMLALSTAQRQQMGRQAKHTSQRYLVDHIGDQWQQLFSQLHH